MAYFTLSTALPSEAVPLRRYPFDYHSHFGGILPVRNDHGPSLVDWLAPGEPDRGELLLMLHALDFMIESNPLALLAARSNRVAYERGECAAENTYIAAVVLLQRFYPHGSLAALPATEPEIYRQAREPVARALAGGRDARQPLLAWARHFNGKVYSGSKYTPFDDLYKTRSSLVKRVCAGDGGEQRYTAWVVATFDYLRGQGVRHIQAAAGADEIPLIDPIARDYNHRHGTRYRLLVHTSAGYGSDGALRRDLDDKVLPLLAGDQYGATIGVDLLGTENKVAHYRELFEFLRDRQAQLAGSFGGGQARSRRMIVHIHCGEGAAAGADNRSLIGYALCNGRLSHGGPSHGGHTSGGDGRDAGFWRELSEYIGTCHELARQQQADNPRGSAGAGPHKPNGLSGLFDELFRHNALTWAGTPLQRFDINAALTRERVAYNGKRSVMALDETFAAPAGDQQPSWYALLAQDSPLYAFRLGHLYCYRNYIAARYPLAAYDTNLGSNAITGAGGLFDSPEGYRINRGFRHLEGYIDTGVLHAAGNAVAYLSTDLLSQAQVNLLMAVSRERGAVAQVLAQPETMAQIKPELRAALGMACAGEAQLDEYYAIYARLVVETVGDSDPAGYRFQALARVLTLFRNWRSFLLGADGQGVEHSQVQDEFLRMLVLLAYQLLPAGQERVVRDTLLELQRLVLMVAACYWQATVEGGDIVFDDDLLQLSALNGFKSPASVVTVQRRLAVL